MKTTDERCEKLVFLNNDKSSGWLSIRLINLLPGFDVWSFKLVSKKEMNGKSKSK